MALETDNIAGHDAPVSVPDLDDYGRWTTAAAISHVIHSAPAEWSTRVGLYGNWGDGKTSVLKFLEQQQRQHGNIVIWYSPWGAANQTQAWTGFGKALQAGLRANGIQLGRLARFRFWIKHRSDPILKLLTGGAKAATSAFKVPIPDAAIDATAGFVKQFLNIDKSDVARIAATLGTKRITIFIDDLDRADPAVIPNLLLGLRELLDFSRFVFVLAFDRTVVARALVEHNPAWGPDGALFLEKVIDFPFALPAPTLEQIEALAKRQFGARCPFIPAASVARIARLLPGNPRRLKLFVRIIESRGPEVRRHDADELDWPTVLIFALLDTISPEFTDAFLLRECGDPAGTDDQTDWMAWALRGTPDDQQEQQLKELINTFSGLDAAEKDSLAKLVHAWQRDRSLIIGERLRYQARFAMRPHNITWNEFRRFVTSWRDDKADWRLVTFVSERARAMEARELAVMLELAETVTSYYGTVLESASDERNIDEHAALIAQASDCVDLFVQVFHSLVVSQATRSQQARPWREFYTACLNWRHFQSNPGEPGLRAKELDALQRCGIVFPNPFMLYETVKPWGLSSLMHPQSAPFKTAFTDAVRRAIEPPCVTATIAFFNQPSFAVELFATDKHLSLRYLLTAPNSPMFEPDAKLRLIDTIKQSNSDAIVRRNAQDYLDCLLLGLEPGQERFCTAEERRTFIGRHVDLMRELWTAAVCAPVQYRFLHGIRKHRKDLLGAGLSTGDLPEPVWLATDDERFDSTDIPISKTTAGDA